MRKGIGKDLSKDKRYAGCPGCPAPGLPVLCPLPGGFASGLPVCCLRPVGPVRGHRFAGAGFVPYAGAVPDGGRHGFEAAETVASPHRLAA
jgi:hypothetical protein